MDKTISVLRLAAASSTELMYCIMALYRGVPSPVTGSNPLVAVKPYWQQLICDGDCPAEQWFSPLVTSWKTLL